MGSKRTQKAKKRAKREARRQTRRAHSALAAGGTKGSEAATEDAADNPLIGFMADDGSDIVRYEDDCLVAESREEMERTAAILCPGRKVTIYRAHFEQLVEFMKQRGEVLRFDEVAQARFSEAAARREEPEGLAALEVRPSEPCEAKPLEPSDVAVPAEPTRSTTLLPPAYVVKSQQCCWNCLSISAVFALAAEGVESLTPSYVEDEGLMLMSRITWLSADLQQLLTSYSDSSFFHDSSSIDGDSHYMNHCDNCGAPFDDFELFSAPGAAFFPMDPEECQRMKLFCLPDQTDLRISGDRGSSNFAWQKFARRQ